MSDEIWLQSEQPDGSFLCESFSGVPAIRESWIVLMSAGLSAKGNQYVAELRAELEAAFLGSSPGAKKATAPPSACPIHPKTMNTNRTAFSDRRKLLVLVGSDDAEFPDRRWFGDWQSDEGLASVMTVLPPGDFRNFMAPVIANNSRHLLCRINANRWEKHIREAVPGILASADVTGSARLFISYRRLETLPIALQFFDRMVKEGFDVFLDRYSIPPGVDFQRRLTQELEDKSMVLLLESKRLNESEWTQHEIDFAKRYRLGLLVMRMPDVTQSDALKSVDASRVMTLTENTPGDFSAPAVSVLDQQNNSFRQWQALKPEKLEEAVAKIKAHHAQALFERRHRLRTDLLVELQTRGLKATYSAIGPMMVGCGSDEHLVWLTTRPPEVEDFRSTYVAHRARTGLSTTSRGIVVGPQAAQETDRKSRLEWLSTVSGCPAFDEARLADFADRLVQGNLP